MTKKVAILLALIPAVSFAQEEVKELSVASLAFFVALLLGGAFVFYLWLVTRKRTKEPTSFLESRLQPESFFGATRTSPSFSQGATVTGYGDVDPVAEADVYLAYGRDLQAEEILKEALKANPERNAILLKLLDIHARRVHKLHFAETLLLLYRNTGGEGEDWKTAVENGASVGFDYSNVTSEADLVVIVESLQQAEEKTRRLTPQHVPAPGVSATEDDADEVVSSIKDFFDSIKLESSTVTVERVRGGADKRVITIEKK